MFNLSLGFAVGTAPYDSLHPFAMVAFSCLRFLHTAEVAYVLRSLFLQIEYARMQMAKMPDGMFIHKSRKVRRPRAYCVVSSDAQSDRMARHNAPFSFGN